MPKLSAGILMYRRRGGNIEVFLVHPGGPFYAKRDAGVWSIPKGEYKKDEHALVAAKREFKEETGLEPPPHEFIPLKPVKQLSGKVVTAWAVEGNLDPQKLNSNTFKMWGKEFPEVDRAEWFSLEEAKKKISAAQRAFLTELTEII